MNLATATHIITAIFALAGLLSLYVALTGAKWFFRSPGVRMLEGSLPLTAARIIYGAIGLAILGMALYIHTHPA